MKIFNMEEELNRQFPKGDKARGRALVLFTLHNIILEEQKKEIINVIESFIFFTESQKAAQEVILEKIKQEDCWSNISYNWNGEE